MNNTSFKKLKVSPNERFLMFEDGPPFFYLGDTAWELFHRLTLQEAEFYLENRKQKQFNVVQAVILAEEDGINTPNANGDKPLFNNDPLQPNESYFQHIDKVIELAWSKGIYLGLLPTWGDKLELLNHGKGPIIFNVLNAFEYGKWIGNRYKKHPNIIWINGGDRKGGDENFQIWDALGKGIKSVDSNHLMTFHPLGGGGGHSSSEWFHSSSWLDFNIIQSGHESRSLRNYLNVERDYNLKPIKPCLDAEPRYEDHAINWKPENGWFNDLDVRQAAYWAIFSGACGHTYGCQPIWQMYDIQRAAVSFVRRFWKEALDLPGAQQMTFLLHLMTVEVNYTNFSPDQSLLAQNKVQDVRLLRSSDTILIYFPYQIEIVVSTPDGWRHVEVTWFNPATGTKREEPHMEVVKNIKIKTPEDNEDYVLILRKMN